MSKRKFSGGISGKGYYIALALCAVAIGISGFLYYRNADQDPAQLRGGTTAATDPRLSGDKDVQVVATKPDGTSATGENTQPSTQPNTQRPAKTVSPVSGETVAGYAMDALSYNQTTRDWRVHDGVDIAAQAGTQVCAAADGTVYTVYDHETMGMTVVIRHEGGYTTQYASLAEEVSVEPGDTVKAGDAIGTVGNTALLESAIGDHVHFSVSCNDTPVDPADFLNQE